MRGKVQERHYEEALIGAPTPIPSAFEEAFVLDQVVVTPDGVYHIGGSSTKLATWSGTVLNAVAAITYAGRIDSVKVNKGEVGLVAVPATVKADGQTFEIYVEATNLSSQAIRTAIEIVVTKPDGTKVYPPIDWTVLAQGVNSKVTFRINIAAVNLAGTWTAVITYLGA